MALHLEAQLITTVPAAPTDDQAVTITFDATQGTGGLADCSCDVYLHTGVITNSSVNLGDWKFVQTEWGVANADWKLNPVAGEPNKYTYTFSANVRTYYGVPTETEIQQIALVFRNADGSLEGKATGGTDIYVMTLASISAPEVVSIQISGLTLSPFVGITETLSVSDPDVGVSLAAGEFRLYIDRPIEPMGGRLPTGLNDREVARLGLSVSPNPTAGALRVDFNLKISSTVAVDLMDATGRVIRSMFSGRLGSGMQSLDIEAGQVAAGLYLLRVSDGAGTGVQPLVIKN